jgi:SecD/SecF fusion protein
MDLPFSAIVVIVSVISLSTNGLDQGVDFVGGRTFQVRFEKPVETELVKEQLSKVFDGSAEVKIFGNDNQLKITTKYKVQDHGTEADEEVNKILFQALKSYYSADLTYDKFVNDGRNLELFKHRRLDLLLLRISRLMHIGRFLELC